MMCKLLGMADVGERIRAARERLGLRQEDVAEMLGVDRNTVGSWEIGRHSPRSKMRRLREVLQLDENLDPIGPVAQLRTDIATASTAELMIILSMLLAQAQEVSAVIAGRLAVAGTAGLDVIQHGKRPPSGEPNNPRPHVVRPDSDAS